MAGKRGLPFNVHRLLNFIPGLKEQPPAIMPRKQPMRCELGLDEGDCYVISITMPGRQVIEGVVLSLGERGTQVFRTISDEGQRLHIAKKIAARIEEMTEPFEEMRTGDHMFLLHRELQRVVDQFLDSAGKVFSRSFRR